MSLWSDIMTRTVHVMTVGLLVDLADAGNQQAAVDWEDQEDCKGGHSVGKRCESKCEQLDLHNFNFIATYGCFDDVLSVVCLSDCDACVL